MTLGVSFPATGALDQVESVLAGFFDSSSNRAGSMGPAYQRLWRALQDSTHGGKRLRPRLVMTAFNGLSGTNVSAAATIAAAFELLHTALIIHDDVIDHDTRRRGVANLAGTYRDQALNAGLSPAESWHRGSSAAIIAGDLALTSTFRLANDAVLPPRVRNRIFDVLDEAVFASAGGEVLDVDFSSAAAAPSATDVMNMSRWKTAVYSFEAPLMAGGLIAGAPDDVVECLGTVGRLTGTAYQLVDDVLGVFGDGELTGKSTTGDLVEGKYTLLMSYASSTAEWEQISALLGQPELTTQQAGQVRQLLSACGSRQYVESQAQEYARTARNLIADAALPEPLAADISNIIDHCVGRNS
ncbi:MAG TPA: polyprenyl synthetase family protein [Arthrobacter sp.]|nr:polyprenyl synthetase family protein [Arthrobacter sp.]